MRCKNFRQTTLYKQTCRHTALAWWCASERDINQCAGLAFKFISFKTVYARLTPFPVN